MYAVLVCSYFVIVLVSSAVCSGHHTNTFRWTASTQEYCQSEATYNYSVVLHASKVLRQTNNMCDKDVCSPTSLDITDLLEYDEYEADDGQDSTAPTLPTTSRTSPAAQPLSVELKQADELKQAANARQKSSADSDVLTYTQSPELFLRLHDTADAERDGQQLNASPEQPPYTDATLNSSGGSSFLCGAELQYENEFEDDVDHASSFAEASSRSFHSQAEANDDEQLLMEGSSCPLPAIAAVVVCSRRRVS